MQSVFAYGNFIKNAEINSKTLTRPVFTGANKNVIQKLSISLKSSLPAKSIRKIVFETQNNYSEKVIASLSISYSPDGDSSVCEGKFISNRLIFENRIPISAGENTFYVSLKLKDSARLDKSISIRCREIEIENEKYPVEKNYNEFAVGRILRKPGDEGVKCFRIPGLATTKKGTLIAVYDIRYNSCVDLPGRIKIGMSRSGDGGESWTPMKIILDMENSAEPDGTGDPSILIDRKTGTIWVAALWSHGNRGWNGSGRGLLPDETGQLLLTKSEDDGLTWSAPINITKQVKDPSWKLFFQGPGNGITLRDGTLVFPAQFRDSTGLPFSTIIYSKDHGKNWSVGTGAKPNTTESQAVELENGALMLNMRDNRGEYRSAAVTSDLGKTWTEHSSSRNALRDPVCMGSLISFSGNKINHGRNILAFSNPDDSKERKNMTVKFSFDGGTTWEKENQLLYDERKCFGYSCLTKTEKNNLGVLYEGKGELYFIKIKLDRILHK